MLWLPPEFLTSFLARLYEGNIAMLAPGWINCIFRCDWICFIVKGIINKRIPTVNRIMAIA